METQALSGSRPPHSGRSPPLHLPRPWLATGLECSLMGAGWPVPTVPTLVPMWGGGTCTRPPVAPRLKHAGPRALALCRSTDAEKRLGGGPFLKLIKRSATTKKAAFPRVRSVLALCVLTLRPSPGVLYETQRRAAHLQQNEGPWFGTLLPPPVPLTLWPGRRTSIGTGGCSGLAARVETLGAHLAGRD